MRGRLLYPKASTLVKVFATSAVASYVFTTLNIETLGLRPNRWYSMIDRSVDHIFTPLQDDYTAAMVRLLSKDEPLDLVDWATIATHMGRVGAQSYAANAFYQGYLLTGGEASSMRNWMHQAYFEYETPASESEQA